MDEKILERIKQAQTMIKNADHILLGAGAGMGVDSGLPDFRGNEGFWKAYPPFEGKSFSEIASGAAFVNNPRQSWGFYGHRLEMYKNVKPHSGFDKIIELAKHKDVFVYTSNVDGQFQKAGIPEERIVECHGSIHHLQCVYDCLGKIWKEPELRIDVSLKSFKAIGDLPTCPVCGQNSRPNILMFCDSAWNQNRQNAAMQRFYEWKRSIKAAKTISIEIGAGTAIPSVRDACAIFPKIRINKFAADVSRTGDVGIALGAREALELICGK